MPTWMIASARTPDEDQKAFQGQIMRGNRKSKSAIENPIIYISCKLLASLVVKKSDPSIRDSSFSSINANQLPHARGIQVTHLRAARSMLEHSSSRRWLACNPGDWREAMQAQ